MRKMIVFALVVAMAVSTSSAMLAGAEEKPAKGEIEVTVLKGTVEKIDLTAREVTLKAADGALETFKVGPEARNLDQVKVGDKVTIKHSQAIAVVVAPPGGQPSLAEVKTVDRAPLGAKPAGVATTNIEATVAIDTVDLTARTIAVRGPKGNVLKMKVGDDVKLETVKPGDQAFISYTEALAVSVEGQ